MKKFICFMSLCLMSIVLCSCGKNSVPLENFSSNTTEDYAAVTLNDKTYVPFCVVDNRDRGHQIGIVDGDELDQIYQYKDFNSEDWIISFYKSGEMDNSMLMREQNVTDIPDGLQSDYEWNNKKEDDR